MVFETGHLPLFSIIMPAFIILRHRHKKQTGMFLPKAQTATRYVQNLSTAPEHSSTMHSNCLIEQSASSSLHRGRGREEGGSLCERRGGKPRCCPTPQSPEGGAHASTESPNKERNAEASRIETQTDNVSSKRRE